MPWLFKETTQILTLTGKITLIAISKCHESKVICTNHNMYQIVWLSAIQSLVIISTFVQTSVDKAIHTTYIKVN